MTFDQSYFDDLYRDNPDPWDFRSSEYEKNKYAATLAALPREHYVHALELGCSIGELTCQLASRADEVTGVDTSTIALDVARAACQHANHVTFVQAHLPGGDWDRPADLVLLSEILYYLDAPSVRELARRIARSAPGADMVLVHWTGATNYPLTGDVAADTFIAEFSTADVKTYRAPHYRLDVITARTSVKNAVQPGD